jgi:hypothetical protein
MAKRPFSITVISWILIAVGGITLIMSLLPLAGSFSATRSGHTLEFWLSPLIQILAIVSGVFMLYGFNWARWLLAGWVGYHMLLSALHSRLEVLVHSLLFTGVLYIVFRPQATAYFRRTRSKTDKDHGNIK